MLPTSRRRGEDGRAFDLVAPDQAGLSREPRRLVQYQPFNSSTQCRYGINGRSGQRVPSMPAILRRSSEPANLLLAGSRGQHIHPRESRCVASRRMHGHDPAGSSGRCSQLSNRSRLLSKTSRVRKNAGTSSFRGAGFACEPGTQEHGLEKSIAWPVFMGSGPGPDGPSRNDTRVFQHPAS